MLLQNSETSDHQFAKFVMFPKCYPIFYHSCTVLHKWMEKGFCLNSKKQLFRVWSAFSWMTKSRF